MAKLGVAAAMAVLALMALAEASIYRTVVTTTIEEEDQGSESQRCREEIHQQRQQLRHCEEYLSSQRGPHEWAIRTVVQPQEEEPHLRECCVALQNINNPRCRCQAVEEALRQEERQGGGSRPQEREQSVERARNLPGRCNLEPRQCRIEAAVF